MVRAGRPAEREAAKLAPLNMRTSPQLRLQIERAAEVNGRSLTQEVERRLMTSFIFDDSRGGPHIGSLANMICSTIAMIEQERGHRWIDDFDTFEMVRAAIDRLLAWKNPGAPLADHIGAIRALVDAEDRAEAAEAKLAEFRADRGINAVDALSPNPTAELQAIAKARSELSYDDLVAEAALDAAVQQARAEARSARADSDAVMAGLISRSERNRDAGSSLADAVFRDLGPR